MTATSLTHFFAAPTTAPVRASMHIDGVAASRVSLRGNEVALAWRCVR